jgi:hypothetical protein
MEKLAQAGEGGGTRPHPFTIATIMYKVVVYARGKMQPPISTPPLYVFCGG